MPIGLIGSLLICTVFYLLVAAGVVGSFGAQPLMDRRRRPLQGGLARALRSPPARPPRADGLLEGGARAYPARGSNPLFGNLLGLAAAIALPSVVLLMMYGQTRIFFVMARDGLLPERLSAVHESSGRPIS